MKIDLLITEIHPGGAEKCCTQLAIYLHQKKHSVRLISIAPPPTSPDESLLWNSLQENNIQVEFLNASKSLKLPWARNQLLRLIRKSKPDIAQTFLWHANLLGAWTYPKFQIPVVAGARVSEPRTYRNKLAWTWRHRVRKVVCVSDEVATWCSEHEGFSAEKLQVIPNGIELPKTWKDPNKPSESPNSEEKILLFVGRLEEQKGIDILIQKAPSILQALPEFQLVIIGQGSWWPVLKKWHNHSPLADRIRLLGRRSDVLDWMRRASLLVLPTRYEGMPNVVLEAMSLGLPIACTRVEGISQLLGEKTQEQSVAAQDWDAWEKLVIDLAKESKTRQSLANSNRHRAEKYFNLDTQLQKYELLYLEILGKISKPSEN
ncbi:MAG: glycosyltransferase family 4 protein [Pirellula sp.]